MAFPENTVNDTGIKHIWDKVTAALSGKVDKVSGKGLSTNDYTTTEKDKLAGIESGAQVNTVTSVAGKTGAVTLDNADVGLGNVDNTSDANKPISTATQNALDTKADTSEVAGTQTATGNPITLTDCAPINAESLVVELEPIQEGSGDPSPTNIRPITGYTECEVEDVGKNRFDISQIETIPGCLTNNGDSLTVTTSEVSSAVNCRKTIRDLMPFAKIGEEYIITANTTGSANYIYLDGAGANFVVAYGNNFIITSDVLNAEVLFYASGVVTSAVISEIMVRLYTEQDSTYEPYHSSNATIQFGQTVYGGSVDFLTGECKVDHIKETKTAISGSKPNYYCTASQAADRTKQLGIICDKMNTASSVGAEGVYINSNGALMLKTSMYESATDLLNAMGGEFDVCFAIAEPFTIQLTPQELKLLKQYNNISTNGTTITLDYIPNNSIGDAVKASEEYTDRAVERVAVDPKATLIDTWMISEESDTISVDLTSYDCNFFLLEYLFMSKRGTTLIPRPSGGSFSASVVTYNNGSALYIELDYNPTTKQLAYTSNITSQFGVLAIYTI